MAKHVEVVTDLEIKTSRMTGVRKSSLQNHGYRNTEGCALEKNIALILYGNLRKRKCIDFKNSQMCGPIMNTCFIPFLLSLELYCIVCFK